MHLPRHLHKVPQLSVQRSIDMVLQPGHRLVHREPLAPLHDVDERRIGLVDVRWRYEVGKALACRLVDCCDDIEEQAGVENAGVCLRRSAFCTRCQGANDSPRICSRLMMVSMLAMLDFP